MNSNVEQSPKSDNSFAKWLEKLQQESWQLELIISGIALLGIWEARTLVVAFNGFTLVYPTSGIQNWFYFFLFLGLQVSWIVLFTNLIIHIISRGIWIGAIGLRYVSGDIDYSKLGYNTIFTEFLKNKTGRFDSYIAKLERF